MGCKVLQCLAQTPPKLAHVDILDSPQLGVDSKSTFLINDSPATVMIMNSCVNAPLLLWLASGLPRLQWIGLDGNQLDDDACSVIAQANWLHLEQLRVHSSMLGLAGVQHLVSCSIPSLATLSLSHVGIDAPAARCLAQGCWPALSILCLQGNNIGTGGVRHLLQGNWPLLMRLVLSDQGLDQEAFVSLG